MMTVRIVLYDGAIIEKCEIYDDKGQGLDTKDIISNALRQSNKKIVILDHETELRKIVNTKDIKTWSFKGESYL